MFTRRASRDTAMLWFLTLCSWSFSQLAKLKRVILITILNICFGTTEITPITTRTRDGVLKLDVKTCAEKLILYRSNMSNAFAKKNSVSNATTTNSTIQLLVRLWRIGSRKKRMNQGAMIGCWLLGRSAPVAERLWTRVLGVTIWILLIIRIIIAVSTNGAGYVKADGKTMEVQQAAGTLVTFMRNRWLRALTQQSSKQVSKKSNLRDTNGTLSDLPITINLLV